MDGRDVSPPVTASLKEEPEGSVWDNDFAESPDLAKFVQSKPRSCAVHVSFELT